MKTAIASAEPGGAPECLCHNWRITPDAHCPAHGMKIREAMALSGGGGTPAAGEREATEIARLKASVPSHLASAIWASARNNAGPVGEREARVAAERVLVAAIKVWPETVDAIVAALREPEQ